MIRKSLFAATLVAAVTLPGAAYAASAVMKSPDGKDMGTLTLQQTAKGVHISGTMSGLELGTHAFHIHAVGKCEPPFKSAGGHFNPHGTKHGKHIDGGPHAGDMDNVVVIDSNRIPIDVYNDAVTLSTAVKHSLFDADGSAVVFHAGPDDYSSQPSGDAGGRVSCGVIK